MIFQENEFNGEMIPYALTSQSATFQRVRMWVDLRPDVVTTPDMEGRYPIHYVATSPSNQSLAIAKFLYEKSPECVQHEDKHGRLPLHYAAASPYGNILEFLLNTYPDGLQKADKDSRRPWHYAECSGIHAALVYYATVEKYPFIDTTDIDLVPAELQWDIVQVAENEAY